jgi:kynurenine formamidase
MKTEDIATRNGFTKIGMRKSVRSSHVAFCWTWLRLKGVETLAQNYEITVDDLQAALAKEGVSLHSGDAVLINTGWGHLWGKDNVKYNAGCPGIGVAAAEWLAKQDVMLLGSDNFPVEISPNPDRNLSLPVHQIALAVNGIFLLENMKLDQLAAQKIYEFAFIVQPLKIKGGTGSTVAPVAVR